MISQISSHEFSGSFWETPLVRNNIKVKKARREKVFASAQRGLCEGRRRVSSPGQVSVEDKGKKR